MDELQQHPPTTSGEQLPNYNRPEPAATPQPETEPVKWKTIKEFREVIDQCMNSFPYIRSSREVSLTFTSLQRAFSWLGEALKATGSPSPYVHSENPTSTVIEPTADHSENSFIERWNPLTTHTARVKDFRAILQEIINAFNAFRQNSKSAGQTYDTCLVQSFVSLKDAKIWLGWELARIKKELEPVQDKAAGPTTPLPL